MYIPNLFLSEQLMKTSIVATANHELLDRGFISNILPFGEDVASEIIELVSTEERKNHLKTVMSTLIRLPVEPLSYGALRSMGASIKGSGVAFENISVQLHDYMLSERGVSKTDAGSYVINFNIFVRYMLTRMHLYVLANTFYAYDFNSGRYVQIDDDTLKAQGKSILHEVVPDIWRPSNGKHVLEQLRIDTNRLECFNENLNILNLKNGMLDLKTFKLNNHSPGIFTLAQLPVSYVHQADCPNFKTYLDVVFKGDTALISMVQEILGYCLTAETKLQAFFIFYGHGSNGKSVLANVLRMILGNDNCSSGTLEQLGSKFGGQVIQNKRLNISAESDSSKNMLNTQQLKLITGEDMVQVESKFKNPIMIRPYVKLIVLSNHYPRTEDTSDGFLRRCVFIPFSMRFVDEGVELRENESYKDKNLMNKLEAEADGIFMWALEGYKRLRDNNFTLTSAKASERLLNQFIIFNNPVKSFILECLVVCENHRETRNDIFNVYQTWCKRNNVGASGNVSTKEFWNLFRQATTIFSGYKLTEKKSNGVRFICGLKLK